MIVPGIDILQDKRSIRLQGQPICPGLPKIMAKRLKNVQFILSVTAQ